MAIEFYRDISVFVPTCDYCGEELEGDMFFDEAVAQKKAAGWKSYKDDEGEWTDMCPHCQRLRVKVSRATAQMDFADIANERA